jgi:nitrate reductase NapD
MNISSMVVRTRPESVAPLKAALLEIPGLEIHAATEDGRLIVTLEDTPEQSVSEAVMRVSTVPGVIAASLVYEYTDTESQGIH